MSTYNRYRLSGAAGFGFEAPHELLPHGNTRNATASGYSSGYYHDDEYDEYGAQLSSPQQQQQPGPATFGPRLYQQPYAYEEEAYSPEPQSDSTYAYPWVHSSADSFRQVQTAPFALQVANHSLCYADSRFNAPLEQYWSTPFANSMNNPPRHFLVSGTVYPLLEAAPVPNVIEYDTTDEASETESDTTSESESDSEADDDEWTEDKIIALLQAYYADNDQQPRRIARRMQARNNGSEHWDPVEVEAFLMRLRAKKCSERKKLRHLIRRYSAAQSRRI